MTPAQHSLSEIDALARKAARGAGYSWGLAEEAGRSVRWLSAYGLPGAASLALWLQRRQADPAAHQPVLADGRWRAPAGVCPLVAGALLGDREAQLRDGQALRLDTVEQPLLALSAVARAVEGGAGTALLRIGEHDIVCRGERLHWPDALAPLCERAPLSAQLREHSQAGDAHRALEPSMAGRGVEADALAVLLGFAHRTYAPATEASRLAGAGAGITDND